MPKITLLFLLLLCFLTKTFAQNNYTIYSETGGTGIVETINFEKVIDKPSHSVDLRAFRFGIGISPKYYQVLDSTKQVRKDNGISYVLVVGYNLFGNWGLSGINPNHFEFGLNGVMITKNSFIEKVWEYKNKVRIFPSANIGFRHQPVDTKVIMWRVSYCPLYINSGLKHWIGASIGYSF